MVNLGSYWVVVFWGPDLSKYEIQSLTRLSDIFAYFGGRSYFSAKLVSVSYVEEWVVYPVLCKLGRLTSRHEHL